MVKRRRQTTNEYPPLPSCYKIACFGEQMTGIPKTATDMAAITYILMRMLLSRSTPIPNPPLNHGVWFALTALSQTRTWCNGAKTVPPAPSHNKNACFGVKMTGIPRATTTATTVVATMAMGREGTTTDTTEKGLAIHQETSLWCVCIDYKVALRGVVQLKSRGCRNLKRGGKVL